MKINSKTTVKDLQLNSGVKSINYTLEESHTYSPGLLISLIHFLLSNLRNRKVSLSIDITNIRSSHLEKKFYNFYQMVAILLFDNSDRVRLTSSASVDKLRQAYKDSILVQEYLFSSEMFSKSIENYETPELRELRKSLFGVKSKSKLTKGFSLLIPCFDHLPELNRSRYLYSGNAIKSTQDIEQWIKRLFKYHKLNLDPSGLHKTTLGHVSEIVNELFHNTHEWARTTFDNQNFLNPNFRGVYLSLYLESRLQYEWGSIDEIHDYVKGVLNTDKDELQIAFNQQSELFSKNTKVSIFEISVIDTGPGMAPRWLENDPDSISKDEEIEAVKKCFHKYITSDSSGIMNLRGQGLSKVLAIIGNMGFIRVHSGRVVLSRNFLQRHLSRSELDITSINFTTSSVNKVEGTCVTILYPILYTE